MYPCQWLKIKSARNQTPDCSVVTTNSAISPLLQNLSKMDYKEISVRMR